MQEIAALREEAKNINTFEEFYYLGQRILLLCQDLHIDFQPNYPSGIEQSNHYISDTAIEISQYAYFTFDKYHPQGSLSVAYIDGNYFIVDEWLSKSNPDKILFPASAKIISINDMPIDEYVAKWNRKVDNSIHWDFTHGKFFTLRIFPPFVTGLSDDYFITYSHRDTLYTKKHEWGSIKGNCLSKDCYDPQVLWLDDCQTLYIRIPSMDVEYLQFFKENIWRHKNTSIEKVVIDVRDNTGGNDVVWTEILSEIIKDPIIYEDKTFLKNTPLVMDYINTIRAENYPLKESEFISISNKFHTDTIFSSNTSIGYDGKIYVLVNNKCFSSTLALVAVCNRVEKLITVGEATGYISGRSITPFFLSLPNSKLIFSIPPTLDESRVKSIKDYYDNSAEIPVTPTIEEKIRERTYEDYRYGKEYLLKNDLIFRTAINMHD
jgi:hypothetical protein